MELFSGTVTRRKRPLGLLAPYLKKTYQQVVFRLGLPHGKYVNLTNRFHVTLRLLSYTKLIGGERGRVVRVLDLSGSPGLKSSSLPLDGFAFGGPEFKSSALCIWRDSC